MQTIAVRVFAASAKSYPSNLPFALYACAHLQEAKACDFPLHETQQPGCAALPGIWVVGVDKYVWLDAGANEKSVPTYFDRCSINF